jgi:uridine kinase
MKKITVHLKGKILQIKPGSCISDILGKKLIRKGKIIAAKLNNNLVDLHTEVIGPAEINLVQTHDPDGQKVLHRSATHVLQAAALELSPPVILRIGQAIIGGFFYELEKQKHDSRDIHQIAKLLNRKMTEFINSDLPFIHRQIDVETGASILTDPYHTKAELLSSWATPMVHVTQLGKFVDINHGPFAPSTSLIWGAKVLPYEPGLILILPDAMEPASPKDGRRIWSCYKETRNWNRMVGVETVAQLNRAILNDRIKGVIRVAEAQHEKKIVEIANAIASRKKNLRIICVAGPSSAGKTTFVQRLSVQLEVNGIQPAIVGLDDYYRNRSECPRDENGEYDFEALEALEVELIQKHFRDILKGETILVPKFDFVHGKRTPPHTWRPLKLEENQVLIVEGIHGINPLLTKGMSKDSVFKIFINALTQLVIDEHNRIYTSDTRLLRRIVRDRRYRGTGAADTIARWPSVQKGEEKHIFPYQTEPEIMFNSSLIFEAAVLKTFAWRYLLEVPHGHPSRSEAYRLLRFLQLFVPVFPDNVPANSVIREFIGGSGFSY